MLLAAMVLLFPISQSGDAAKAAVSPSVEISSQSSDDSSFSASLSQPELSAPEPKVKTDAEVAAEAAPAAGAPIQPGPAVPPISAVKPAVSVTTEDGGQKKLWYALSITGSGAAAFDAWSTRRAITEGYGVEANPMLRPFSHNASLYAATQVSPLLMDFIGKRMMKSHFEMVRKVWWLPQAVGSSVSLAAGIHNTRMVP